LHGETPSIHSPDVKRAFNLRDIVLVAYTGFVDLGIFNRVVNPHVDRVLQMG
jgi:hypothetical protein